MILGFATIEELGIVVVDPPVLIVTLMLSILYPVLVNVRVWVPVFRVKEKRPTLLVEEETDPDRTVTPIIPDPVVASITVPVTTPVEAAFFTTNTGYVSYHDPSDIA